MKKTKGLTAKQRLFVSEYLIGLNATQAAIKAGYSAKTAQQISSRLLLNVFVKAEIDRLIKEREQKTGITAEYVLTSIKEVAQRCLQRVPVMRFDKETKRYIQETATIRKPNGDFVEEGIWQFDSAGANTALANLGKHLKLFTEKIEADVRTDRTAKELTDDELSDIISRRRSGGAAGASQSSPKSS
jgi:phage terminase small subunit